MCTLIRNIIQSGWTGGESVRRESGRLRLSPFNGTQSLSSRTAHPRDFVIGANEIVILQYYKIIETKRSVL